jgi:hypothetical protein
MAGLLDSVLHRNVLVPDLGLHVETIGLAKVIDGGHVQKHIERKIRRIAQSLRNDDDIFSSDMDSFVATLAVVFNDQVTKLTKDVNDKR